MCGQRAANLEAANVLGGGNDHQFDGVAGQLVADFGVGPGEEAHCVIILYASRAAKPQSG